MAHTLASTDASAVVLATPELTTVNGQVTTTSQQIAEHFGKTHKSVLRSIRNLGAEMPAETYRRNFAPIQIGVDLGMGRIRQDPAYRITRDGFALLAMGFTGKEALHWKLAYIEAFNRMESALLAPAAPIQAAQPALDYTRISPAQRQHLKELVDLVVESGRQKTHGETWTRFHRKMKVNKYELLPASQFDEACAYLHGKMDDTSMAVLIQKHFPGGVMAALQLQAAPKKYHFPLEAADPHGRQFGNAWLTPRVLLDPKNRPLELELIEQLEKDGHDVMGVKIRILAMRDAMGRAEDARGFLQHVHDRLGPLLENCKVGLMERGKNVQFVGKPNPNSAIDRFVFRDQMGR